MSRESRRSFLKHSLAATTVGGLFSISGTRASGNVLGANERIRVAVVGIHGRGKGHVSDYAGQENVEVAYLVDVDSETYGPMEKLLESRGAARPKCVQDIRRALDDPGVDCISIATPNHWHALMTIWGCQAGKHVYVEKPSSHNVYEGRVAMEAARKHNRIVQHGTQRRSEPRWAGVMDFINSGEAGKLLVARGLCYKPRNSIGFKQPEAVPSNIDFNLWLGPAPEQPFHRNLVHYNWHWFWDTGNGDIGNQGVHQMDVARWGIQGARLPTSVVSFGGRVGYEDQGQTPNTQVCVLDYGSVPVIFEVRGLPTDAYRGAKIGNVFHLEGGTIVEGTFYPKDSDKGVALPKGQRGPGSGHIGNFIAAVRTGSPSDLNAEIAEGHYSSAMCHLANISYRLGEAATVKSIREALGGHESALETLERTEKHLAANNLSLGDLKLTLGRRLTFDPAVERFVDNERANALLTRNYRKGFEVVG